MQLQEKPFYWFLLISCTFLPPAAQRQNWLEERRVQRLCNWRSHWITWYVTQPGTFTLLFLSDVLSCFLSSDLQPVWRLGCWDVEALLRSLLPLNIIYGEPLEWLYGPELNLWVSGWACDDSQCVKSNRWPAHGYCRSRTDVYVGFHS